MATSKRLQISSDGVPDGLTSAMPHDETTNKVHDVIYQNKTGKTMIVIIQGELDIKAAGDSAALFAFADNVDGGTVQVGQMSVDDTDVVTSNLNFLNTITFLVPPNFFYQVQASVSATGTATIDSWMEYY